MNKHTKISSQTFSMIEKNLQHTIGKHLTTYKIQGLYRAEQVSKGEREVAKMKQIKMATLMEQAGKVAYELMRERWKYAKNILICCGGGNNGGDGYVVARLALLDGLAVDVWQIVPVNSCAVDAIDAYDAYLKAGGKITQKMPNRKYNVIVDALFGIGLDRDVTSPFIDAIELINQHSCPVLSIDIPSGLNANTGAVMNMAIRADLTISFIGLKQGLFTGYASDYCGEIVYAPLGMQKDFEKHVPISATLLQLTELIEKLPKRAHCVHKGNMGKVLCVGGGEKMGGALILCGQAALRTGAGLVTLLCSKKHHNAVLSCQPELMLEAWKKNQKIEKTKELLDKVNVFAIGPGLGRSAWSNQLFQSILNFAFNSSKPMVVDADALYWLAQYPHYYDNWILTPHPQEAARLLGIDVQDVNLDRFSAVKLLQQTYGGIVLLKGAGTIVYDGAEIVVIHAGNAGMASAGMGDVLTGVITALFAQGLPLFQAAKFGAFLHSFTADCAAIEGQRGMIASDLLPLLGKELSYLISSFVKHRH